MEVSGMTATQANFTPAYRVGDWIRVKRQGKPPPGRISSIHRKDNGVEYLVGTDGGTGGDVPGVLNIWTTSGQSSFLRHASVSGETR
jgi:hypothetical protein